MVDLKSHAFINFEILIEVEPRPIKRLLPLRSPVSENPDLMLMVKVDMGLKFG